MSHPHREKAPLWRGEGLSSYHPGDPGITAVRAGGGLSSGQTGLEPSLAVAAPSCIQEGATGAEQEGPTEPWGGCCPAGLGEEAGLIKEGDTVSLRPGFA